MQKHRGHTWMDRLLHIIHEDDADDADCDDGDQDGGYDHDHDHFDEENI